MKARDEILALLTELFGDKEKAERWYGEPQEWLFGKSPADIVLLGEAQPLIKELKERAGK